MGTGSRPLQPPSNWGKTRRSGCLSPFSGRITSGVRKTEPRTWSAWPLSGIGPSIGAGSQAPFSSLVGQPSGNRWRRPHEIHCTCDFILEQSLVRQTSCLTRRGGRCATVALARKSSFATGWGRRGRCRGSALVSRYAVARRYAPNVPAGLSTLVCGDCRRPRADPCAGPPDGGAFTALHSGLLAISGFLRKLRRRVEP